MKHRTAALFAATLAAACALLIFPAQAAAGALKGVSYSLEILIPSLYPFMVLSVFVVRSGLSAKLGKRLEGATRALFRLPGGTAASVLMSAIGGYPAGARSVASLYEAGAVNEEQAQRMLYFCVNAGPSFLITAVGAGFLKSPSSGALLFCTQLTVFLLLGLISGALGRAEKVGKTPEVKADPGAVQAFIASAADGASSVLSMCCFVILFAAVMNLLRLFPFSPGLSAAVSSLLEVTGGCSDLSRLGAPLWAVAFAVGWGGICVHFQVFAFTAAIRYSRVRFLFFRFLQGVLSAAVCKFYLLLLPQSVEASVGTSGFVSAGLSGSVPASAALIALCVILILSVGRKGLESGG